MAKNNQKTYNVELTCIYNGNVRIKAESEDEAYRIANEMLDADTLKDFPDEVKIPNGSFQFGEATAEWAEEIEDDDNVADNSDNVADECASGVVREYNVCFCDEKIFGDDEEHQYDVDCADGAAVAYAQDKNDPATLLLTYPKMDEVITNEDMVDEIRDYRGFNYNEKIHYGDIMMFCGEIVAKI